MTSYSNVHENCFIHYCLLHNRMISIDRSFLELYYCVAKSSGWLIVAREILLLSYS